MLERYNAVQTVAFCGVFPEIRRAWASVDNELFLWRLDRWWAHCISCHRNAAGCFTQWTAQEHGLRGTHDVRFQPDSQSSAVPGTTCQ